MLQNLTRDHNIKLPLLRGRRDQRDPRISAPRSPSLGLDLFLSHTKSGGKAVAVTPAKDFAFWALTRGALLE
jgi:hypothetical protein